MTENQFPFSEIDKEIIYYTQNDWKYSSTGYISRNILIWRDNEYIQYATDEKQQILKIYCNNKDKTMKITKVGQEEHNYYSSCENTFVVFNVVDIDSQGLRWEGNTFQSKPHGYGKYFNSDNQLIYSGFIYNQMKVCYGIEIFPKSGIVEYCGGFLQNKRHGYGKQYDKHGNLMYEGDWLCGTFQIQPKLSISNNTLMENLHNLLEKFVVSDNCCCGNDYKQLSLIHYSSLKIMWIGNHCFSNTNQLIIQNCMSLHSLTVGEYSFAQEPPCSSNSAVLFRDLPNLQMVTLQNTSFRYCVRCIMENLPKVQSIAFEKSSFENSLYLELRIDLPSITTLSFGLYCFQKTKSLSLQDLANIQSIQTDYCCFFSAEELKLYSTC